MGSKFGPKSLGEGKTLSTGATGEEMHTVTDRGFKRMEPFKCSYGSEVAVYESSAATGPHIWLKVHCDTKVLSRQKEGEGTAHLTLEQACRLRDQLNWLLRNHYQIPDMGELDPALYSILDRSYCFIVGFEDDADYEEIDDLLADMRASLPASITGEGGSQ
jgi:hypothetical protein